MRSACDREIVAAICPPPACAIPLSAHRSQAVRDTVSDKKREILIYRCVLTPSRGSQPSETNEGSTHAATRSIKASMPRSPAATPTTPLAAAMPKCSSRKSLRLHGRAKIRDVRMVCHAKPPPGDRRAVSATNAEAGADGPQTQFGRQDQWAGASQKTDLRERKKKKGGKKKEPQVTFSEGHDD